MFVDTAISSESYAYLNISIEFMSSLLVLNYTDYQTVKFSRSTLSFKNTTGTKYFVTASALSNFSTVQLFLILFSFLDL